MSSTRRTQSIDVRLTRRTQARRSESRRSSGRKFVATATPTATAVGAISSTTCGFVHCSTGRTLITKLGKTLRRVRTAFLELEVGWYVFGARAAIAYGVVRATDDIDVTVNPEQHSAAAIARALASQGFVLAFPDPDFVAQTRVLPVRDASGVAVDVVLGGSGYDARILSRVEKRKLGGVIVPVAAPEDIIVMKILAGRDKDSTDVRDMLNANRSIRPDMVRETLAELEEALDQSDLLPAFERLLKAARPRG